MVQKLVAGLIAGAVGTVTLNVATYADMALRGRSSSSAPSQLVGTLAKDMNLPLSSKGVGAQDEQAQNRQSGLGSLLGYGTGLGVAVAYGLLRSQFTSLSLPLAGIGVGLTAMAASDIPLIATHVSDPKSWGVSGWVSDLIPHLLYGLITVITYEVLADED